MSTTKKAPPRSIIGDILARRKPREKQVRLLLDGETMGLADDLRREITLARAREKIDSQGLASPVPVLERRLAELLVGADESAVAFTFRAIPRVEFEELRRQFQPTEEQWSRYREAVKSNMFTPPPEADLAGLAPVLIAACCADPAMSDVDAQQLWDELSDGEAAQLFDAAWAVNVQVTDRPFSGTDTVTTPNSGPDLTTSQNGDSPSPSLAEGS